MPDKVTNKTILKLIKKNMATREALIAEAETYDQKIDKLNMSNRKFVDLMNEEYGYGNWHNFNAKDFTFETRNEIMGKYYIIANPAIKEKVQINDVNLKVENSDELQISSEENSQETGSQQGRGQRGTGGLN